MSELNRRHDYGLDLFLLSVDEGITGYRDDSLETVKRNEIQVYHEHLLCLQDSLCHSLIFGNWHNLSHFLYEYTIQLCIVPFFL